MRANVAMIRHRTPWVFAALLLLQGGVASAQAPGESSAVRPEIAIEPA